MRTKLTALALGFLLAVIATVVLAVGKPQTCIWPCNSPNWTTVTLTAPYVTCIASRTVALAYWIKPDGNVVLDGCVYDPGGAGPNVIATLPAEIRPTTYQSLYGLNPSSNFGQIMRLQSSGVVDHISASHTNRIEFAMFEYDPRR